MLPIKLLLVEDNPRDARVVQIALAEIPVPPFKVEVAGDLATARKFLEAGKTDIVLLDLNLPDSMGLDTLKSLTAEHDEIPIIVLTGLEDEDMGIEALRAGAQDFLVKGAMFGALLQRSIRYAIERHRILQDVRS